VSHNFGGKTKYPKGVPFLLRKDSRQSNRNYGKVYFNGVVAKWHERTRSENSLRSQTEALEGTDVVSS